MRNWIVLTTLLLFGFGGAPAAAQTFGFGAHAGVSVPTGDFADAAELGYLGGLDLWYPLVTLVPGLSWYTSADAIGHSAEGQNLDGGYLLAPIMTGLQFDVPVGPLALFANGQVGAILTRGPSSDADNVLVDSELGTEFGFNVGGGLQITDQLYAGLKYYPLGNVEFEYEGTVADATRTRDVSLLTLYVGFGVR